MNSHLIHLSTQDTVSAAIRAPERFHEAINAGRFAAECLRMHDYIQQAEARIFAQATAPGEG